MHKWTLAVAGLAAAAMAGFGCTSSDSSTRPSTAADTTVKTEATATRDIDPAADTPLRRMCDTLAAAKSFKLHSMATMEQRMESGQLVQIPRDAVMVVSRPDKLQADVRRGSNRYRIWHQGKEVTILDVGRNLYTVIETPQRIDEMLDFLAERYDIIVPLDDLLYPNPYEGLTQRVKTGVYVDRQSIDGQACDHLLFKQENVDWQVWIDAKSPALPRKAMITYKDDPDQPQYEAALDQWQLDPPTDAAQFTPQLPPQARRVDITELVGSREGGEK